jgi:site-specific DNA recombinase
MPASRRVRRLQARRQEAAVVNEAKASRAVGYIRVSTEDQVEDGRGLEIQDDAIRAFARSQNYELVGVIADKGISGSTRPAERAGFRQVIDLAASGDISFLLVWKFDRLARQIVYAVVAVSELADLYDVAIRSVTEPIDTATPMGRTIFAVLAGMAEQERENITERTWNGRKAKAKTGGYACGGVPFGYDVDGDGQLVINASEAPIVVRMFGARADRKTFQQIADALNRDAIKTRRGKAWRAGGVQYILDNPIYAGEIEYLFRRFGGAQHVRERGEHEPIIKQTNSELKCPR